jgi:hypothetical protein
MGINIGGRCCGRNIVFDSLIGLNPSGSCPVVCDTVGSVEALPDPPTGCDFILVYEGLAPRYSAGLYEWHDGTGWHHHVRFNLVEESNGTFIQFEYEGLDGWQVIVNGVSYTGIDLITFDTPVYYIEVEFVSPDGCRYTVPPFGEVPCYYYWDDVVGFSSCTIYPEGGAGVPIFSYQDVLLLQQDYPYFSLSISPTDFGSPLLIYAPASVLSGWEINYGIGQVPMTWLPTSPDCPVQENFCYTATLNIDLTTYPAAIIQDINGVATGSSIQLSPSLLSDTATLEVSLGEYLSVLYGGVVTCTITYVGTTYTIVIQNIPYYDITNPIIFPLSSITVERDAFDYVDMNVNQNTCP